MKPGAIVHLKSFTHVAPNTKMAFNMPNSKLGVFVLLGYADKKDPTSFDIESAMKNFRNSKRKTDYEMV